MVEPVPGQVSAQSDISSTPSQDIVAELPDEVAAYRSEHGSLPAGMQFEPGVYCVWGKRTFIHTRATLPLLAVDEGVGFGLWVEVEPAEFQRYISAVTDDAKYGSFQTKGILANSWPGFFQTIGLPVKVMTVRMNEKVYITEVSLDRVRDVLFETALSTDFTPGVRDDILVLVQDWLQIGGSQAEESVELEMPPANPEPTFEPTIEPDQVVITASTQAEPASETQFESQPEPEIEAQPETQVELQQPMALQAESPLEQQQQVEQQMEWESEPQPRQDVGQQSADQLVVGQENLQVDSENNQPASTHT